MVAVILVIAVLVIGGVSIAFGWRKKHYADIDRLEERKIELMNSPVLEEVSRIRNLNVDGEAQKAFVKWREQWEEVVTEYFPKMEENFFMCETQIEKFRFKKAIETKEEISDKLDEIEKIIDRIFAESRELLELAEQNSANINNIQEKLNEQKQYIFAINHLLGRSAVVLDGSVSDLLEEVRGIQSIAESGDYYEAKIKFEEVDGKYRELVDIIKVIPDLLTECKENIPEAIEMLKTAHEGMERDGFPLGGLKINEKIQEFEICMKLNVQSLEIAIIDNVRESIQDVNEKINEICRQLETESKSRVVVKEKIPTLIRMLGDNKKSFDQLLKHIENAKDKYKIPDAVEDGVVTLGIKFASITEDLGKSGRQFAQKEELFSILEKQLLEIDSELIKINEDLIVFLDQIAMLCVDEQNTINKLEGLREFYKGLEIKVRFSNAPGIPTRYETICSDTLSSLDEVSVRLQDKPLNITALKDSIDSAEEKVNHLDEATSELIENVELAEKVIQYGNRYRIGNEKLSEELTTAGEKFLIFEYEEALEIASIAIENVEPGFFKKFDKMLIAQMEKDVEGE